jgi:putative transposase
LSCRFTTGAFGLADADRRHVKLPRIGLVRTHELGMCPGGAVCGG